MERPTTKTGYTEQDLRVYARWRKEQEFKDINKVLADESNTGKDSEAQPIDRYDNENYREPLCIDKEYLIHIQLSTGGDGDGFKLFYNANKELIKGLYYWCDWGVYEEVPLSDEEADMIADYYNVYLGDD